MILTMFWQTTSLLTPLFVIGLVSLVVFAIIEYSLDFSYMCLVGTIPLHIGNLSFLVILSVINNNFHGSVVNKFARLYQLRHLSFKNNNLNNWRNPIMDGAVIQTLIFVFSR